MPVFLCVPTTQNKKALTTYNVLNLLHNGIIVQYHHHNNKKNYICGGRCRK